MKYCLSIALCLFIVGCTASEQTNLLHTSLNAASGEKYLNDDSLFNKTSGQNGLIATGVVLGVDLLISGIKAISNAFSSSDDEPATDVVAPDDRNATNDNTTTNQ